MATVRPKVDRRARPCARKLSGAQDRAPESCTAATPCARKLTVRPNDPQHGARMAAPYPADRSSREGLARKLSPIRRTRIPRATIVVDRNYMTSATAARVDHVHLVREMLTPGERSALASARQGEFVALFPGVYLDAALWQRMTPTERYRARVKSASLVALAETVFSHLSVASLWRLPLVGAWPKSADVLVPPSAGGRSTRVFQRHTVGIPAPYGRDSRGSRTYRRSDGYDAGAHRGRCRIPAGFRGCSHGRRRDFAQDCVPTAPAAHHIRLPSGPHRSASDGATPTWPRKGAPRSRVCRWRGRSPRRVGEPSEYAPDGLPDA